MPTPNNQAEILYTNFVKYDALNHHIKGYMLNRVKEKPEIVNVYIDLYQMLTYLFLNEYIEDPINIASCLINHAIHYRNYFRRYCDIYPNVFLVYSPARITHCQKFCPEWNSTSIYREEMKPVIVDDVTQAMELVKVIVPYLPDIYLRIGTFETSVIISDMINKFAQKGMKVPSLVVSSSQYAFQIPAYIPNTFLLYAKHYMNEDTSVMASYEDCVPKFIKETKHHIKKFPKIDKKFITMIMICLGIPKRSITSLFDYRSTLNMIAYLASSFTVPSVDEMLNVMLSNKPLREFTAEEIARRYNCIDLIYQLQLYNTMPESKETSYLAQLQDIETLHSINEEYFKENPISLGML